MTTPNELNGSSVAPADNSLEHLQASQPIVIRNFLYCITTGYPSDLRLAVKPVKSRSELYCGMYPYLSADDRRETEAVIGMDSTVFSNLLAVPYWEGYDEYEEKQGRSSTRAEFPAQVAKTAANARPHPASPTFRSLCVTGEASGLRYDAGMPIGLRVLAAIKVLRPRIDEPKLTTSKRAVELVLEAVQLPEPAEHLIEKLDLSKN